MNRQMSMDFDNLGVNELEQQVYELIKLCDRLREENATLRTRESRLLKERTELMERNETARERVESIITRLKDMETEA